MKDLFISKVVLLVTNIGDESELEAAPQISKDDTEALIGKKKILTNILFTSLQCLSMEKICFLDPLYLETDN